MIKEEEIVHTILQQEDDTQALYELACYYDQQGNTNGARYLAMQLQKRMIPEEMESFVEQYCSFLIEKKQMIRKRLLLLCLLISAILSLIMFILQIHFGIIIFQLISCVIIVYYALKNKMIKHFLIAQESALKPYVNEEVWNHLNS